MNLQIKTLRMKRGIKQDEMARLCGWEQRRYASYEREERGLTLEDACTVADVLGCTLDELAGRMWLDVANADESELVDCYRDLEPQHRRMMLSNARTLSGRAVQDNSPRLSEGKA